MSERKDGTRRMRALIADDEPRARQFMEKLLGEQQEVDVVATARGGVEALERIAEHRPDVAFLDIQMPDLSGLEVVRHLREVKLLELDEVPIVFSRDRLVLARCAGHEYLVDYTLQELERRLPTDRYLRVHRGALVNADAIESYGGEDGVLVLRLKDG